MATYQLLKFNDLHVHFRDYPRTAVAKFSAPYCDHVLPMPNTDPPLTTPQATIEYAETIRDEVGPDVGVVPCMMLTAQTAPEQIRAARDCGVLAAKYYPRGLTTNSRHGLENIWHARAAVEAMQAVGMVLCLHGEESASCRADNCCLDWERNFLRSVFLPLRHDYPRLRIVLEHITTAEAVRLVSVADKSLTAATITAHHLLVNIDDLIGDRLEPRIFCKPLPKTLSDMFALSKAAFARELSNVFLGSDSAPHPKESKFGDCGCAGAFTAPYLPLLLAQAAQDALGPAWLPALLDFTSLRGAKFYGLRTTSGYFEITDESFKIPPSVTIMEQGKPAEFPLFAGGGAYALETRFSPGWRVPDLSDSRRETLAGAV